VSQKSIAGSAAFQAAGAAEVPFQGFRLLSRWPAGTCGSRQDAGAPRGGRGHRAGCRSGQRSL